MSFALICETHSLFKQLNENHFVGTVRIDWNGDRGADYAILQLGNQIDQLINQLAHSSSIF